MNYRESRVYIDEAQRYGSVLGLDNMREMLNRLGNPQDSLKFIHVAGTNGKGSVLAYIATVLKCAGYRVGRYVSPPIYTYLERMEINGSAVSEEAFAEHLTAVAEVIAKMTAEGLPHPTPFEIETAVAFLYFKAENCDIVALETGLGGLLDATNLITTTVLAVITSISMDHMAFLGNTLYDIARNKAGIIKPGCRVVTAKQKSEAMEAVEKACRRCGAPMYVADSREAHVKKSGYAGQVFEYHGEIYEIQMAGLYQIENAVVALQALEVLQGLGFPVSEEQIREGMSQTQWGGRFTVLAKEPVFIIDGAHNPDAAVKLEESIQEYFPGKNIYYIMGVFKDKEYEKVAQITAGYAREIYTIATPRNERALPAEDLARVVKKYNSRVWPKATLQEAVDAAYEKAGKEDVIIAFGSLSFLGEITRIVKRRQEKKDAGFDAVERRDR